MSEKFEFLHNFDDHTSPNGIGSVLSKKLYDEIYQSGFDNGKQKGVEDSQGQISDKSYEQGYEAASETIGAKLVGLQDQLTAVIGTQQHMIDDLGGSVKSLLQVCIEKLTPYYANAGAIIEVSKLVEKVIKLRGDDNKITIIVNTDIKEQLIAKLQEILTTEQMSALIISGDDKIESCDCKINWLDGGIERCLSDLQNKMGEVVDKLFSGDKQGLVQEVERLEAKDHDNDDESSLNVQSEQKEVASDDVKTSDNDEQLPENEAAANSEDVSNKSK